MTKQVQLRNDAYKRLKELKDEKSSFSDVIESLIDKAKGICGAVSGAKEPKPKIGCPEPEPKKKLHHKKRSKTEEGFFGF